MTQIIFALIPDSILSCSGIVEGKNVKETVFSDQNCTSESVNGHSKIQIKIPCTQKSTII